ncbi:MAG: hypothetical protein GY723_19170, partial [bacterium]|nr:hypothetical protein [bacterium]
MGGRWRNLPIYPIPDDLGDWRDRVASALDRLGSTQSIEPGGVVRPDAWTSVTQDASEDEVRGALREAFSDASVTIRRLLPRVDFRSTHERAFRARDRRVFVAATAARRPHS